MSDKGKFANKRKNPLWYKSAKTKLPIASGTAGLFFTYGGDEKFAVREAYNLIDTVFEENEDLHRSSDMKVGEGESPANEVSDKHEKHDSEDEDIADSIKRFCEEG